MGEHPLPGRSPGVEEPGLGDLIGIAAPLAVDPDHDPLTRRAT
jgi:hypothetical protein